MSAKLPGEPLMITAVGPSSAEMATDVGAIYTTENAGGNWTALVQGAIGVLRNINRSQDGQYVAVSFTG